MTADVVKAEYSSHTAKGRPTAIRGSFSGLLFVVTAAYVISPAVVLASRRFMTWPHPFDEIFPCLWTMVLATGASVACTADAARDHWATRFAGNWSSQGRRTDLMLIPLFCLPACVVLGIISIILLRLLGLFPLPESSLAGAAIMPALFAASWFLWDEMKWVHSVVVDAKIRPVTVRWAWGGLLARFVFVGALIVAEYYVSLVVERGDVEPERQVRR